MAGEEFLARENRRTQRDAIPNAIFSTTNFTNPELRLQAGDQIASKLYTEVQFVPHREHS
jgi:hypothetical protein